MESRNQGVFIETADTSVEVMMTCLSQLFFHYGIKKIDSISCDKQLKGFRVHFTKAEDSKRFENGLHLQLGILLMNVPPKEIGKSKRMMQADETNKVESRVRSSTRSLGEAGPSFQTTPKQAAKRNGGKAISNFTTKKQKTTQGDVSEMNIQKMLSDFFSEKKKAGASERKSDENSKSTSADQKEKINPSRLSTPSGSSQIVTPTNSAILGAADTSILSDELQGCINHACETIGHLDRQTLDAFLGHVKKKSKPTQIALKYTLKIKELKDQLKRILSLYYLKKPTKQVKEDAAFIKWLEGLMSRFDNTEPRK